MKKSWSATKEQIRALAETYASEEVSWPDDWREHLWDAMPNQDARYQSEAGTLDIIREIDFYNLESEAFSL